MPRVSLFMPLSRPEAASASPCMAASPFPGPYNCASTRFAQTQVGNFLAHGRVVDSARNRNLGSRICGTLFRFGGPMTVQRDQKHHRDFVRGAKHQLTLLGAATLVLLFFAWTYLD